MLEQFLKANKVDAQLLESPTEIRAVEKLAKHLGLPLSAVAKCVLFVEEKRLEAVLALFESSKQIDLPKLENASGLRSLRPALPQEALEMAGYPVESIPPISVYGIKTFLSKSLLEKKEIFCPGGDYQHILKIPPAQIQEFGFEVEAVEII